MSEQLGDGAVSEFVHDDQQRLQDAKGDYYNAGVLGGRPDSAGNSHAAQLPPLVLFPGLTKDPGPVWRYIECRPMQLPSLSSNRPKKPYWPISVFGTMILPLLAAALASVAVMSATAK